MRTAAPRAEVEFKTSGEYTVLRKFDFVDAV
jgi:hypothetical protein